jgi:ATP-dependent Lon protease
MEVINLSGYTEEEKLQIARRYLVPRQIKENGIEEKELTISDEAVRTIIAKYTREAGLRNLEREIGSVCRKVARRIAEGEKRNFVVNAASVARYLGPPKFLREEEMERNEIGVATGLAWTPVGGEVLFVEATVMKGKGGLNLTGQLGDVMKESVQAALSYIRSKEAELSLPDDFYHNMEIHVHVPAGAIPKDGPSAGVTMVTALVSALTRIPVKKDVAMTGEITLRGKVLPIGGLKEKMLAAIRMGVKTVIIPELNKKDLADIPRHIMKKVRVVIAKNIDDVLKTALEKYPPSPVLPGKSSTTKGKAVPRRVLVASGKGVTAGAKS